MTGAADGDGVQDTVGSREKALGWTVPQSANDSLAVFWKHGVGTQGGCR